ncbi:cytochrome P450 [Armillaria gallica]|uniref:Cytochrome P450 n=1 Tax=Armillaria gallica TaxID=47427 RepID=A0A2H3CMC0_ARMGA|nr:cytochrome P450 [Armillaria gallica]
MKTTGNNDKSGGNDNDSDNDDDSDNNNNNGDDGDNNNNNNNVGGNDDNIGDNKDSGSSDETTATVEITTFATRGETLSSKVIINNLKHLFACFNEAHQPVPVTINLPRVTTEDTALGQWKGISSFRRALISLSTLSPFVIHNPHDFPKPEKYIPSRWYGVPEHDFFMFGFGPRACVGRKFAQTEAVCFLAHFLRDWKVEVVLEAGETVAQT